MEFTYDGGGPGRGGTATLYVDGKEAGSTGVERTHPAGFNLDETNDVGPDSGAPVTDDYPATGNDFTGTIRWIRIELGERARRALDTTRARMLRHNRALGTGVLLVLGRPVLPCAACPR